MILHKSHRLLLLMQIRVQIIPNQTSAFVTKQVVQLFIVGVVEALLQKLFFQAPIDLSHEHKIGILLLDFRNGIGPEWLGQDSPGLLKNFWKEEHCHVAANTVTQLGYLKQFCYHLFS